MSGVGSQTGGFNSPHIPVRNGPNNGSDKQPAIKTVGPQTVIGNKPKAESLDAKQEPIAEKLVEQREINKELHQQIAKQRASADSFSARTASNTSKAEEKQSSAFAADLNKDKELQLAKRQEFVQRIQNSKIATSQAETDSNAAEPESSQKESLTANAAQAQVESLDPDARARKKLEAKLQRISAEGGAKGKGFVDFVRREMAKGPLPESIAELVDGFLETLRGSALTPSQMITAGDEPLITLRGIVAADNHEEQIAMQDSLSRSVVNSAGERSDLLVVRNLAQNQKVPPPEPQQSLKVNKIGQAVEFVSFINKANLPWDLAILR